MITHLKATKKERIEKRLKEGQAKEEEYKQNLSKLFK